MKKYKPSNKERIEHILQAIQKIEKYIENLEEKDFINNDMVTSAVLYQFFIMGEAVANISSDLLEKYDYPWHKPRSFRNFIAHEYYGVELWVIWKTIKNQIPEFKKIIKKILEKEF